MAAFKGFESYKRLEQLAENPVDLTKKGSISPKRLEQFSAKALGMRLFYGTERINEDVLEALSSLAEESGAVASMRDMQNGEILNCIEEYESENRRVLHTAMRDFFDMRSEAPAAKEATQLAYQELEKLRSFLNDVEKGGYTDLVQIGIGGSELGPKAMYLALKAFSEKNKRVHFISNIDPDEASDILNKVELSKTLVVVVSKSGSTLETRTNEHLVRARFKKAGLEPLHHLVAVTGKGSPMDDPQRYRSSFYIWDYVGGRYSATSMVGALAIAFAIGMEKLLEFLRGASAMDRVALEQDPKKNLPLMNALLGIWNRNFLHCPTEAIIPYSQALSRFPAHLQQLNMESNGKRIDKRAQPLDFATGPIIWGEPGTNGQHSFYQLIHQGTDTVPVTFIGFTECQRGGDSEFKGSTSQEKLLANLFAQSIGLATGKADENPNKHFPGNRPNRVLLAKKCDPFTLGALLAYYEHSVAFQGFIWNINSFDQEGVQLGKVLANQIISLYAKRRLGEEPEKGDLQLGQFFINAAEEL